MDSLFKPVPMCRVSLLVMREDAPLAVVALTESGVFNPEPLEAPGEELAEYPAQRYHEVHHSALSRLSKIGPATAPVKTAQSEIPRVVPLDELERLDERLGQLWSRFSALEEEHQRLSEKLQSLQHLRGSLRKFSALNIDLGLFQHHTRFLSLHVGTVARSNLDRLKRAALLAGNLVQHFNLSGNTAYVVVAGVRELEWELNPLLKAADFHPLEIPPEFTDYPEKIKQGLDQQIGELKQGVAIKSGELKELEESYAGELTQARKLLTLAAPYAGLAGLLRGQGALTAVEGWIPAAKVNELSASLTRRLPRPFVLNSRKPELGEYPKVPSLIRHGRFLRAFAALVKNYGVPRYGEFDPTWLFTITFILMFGMMFGDLGHGAVFILIGVLLRQRFPGIMPFLAAAGGSSMLFGALYGSLFGFEELFHPLWISPLSDPQLMLKLALYWGIGFVLVVNLLTVWNLVTAGRLTQALLDSQGVAGVMLYIGGLYGVFRWMQEGVYGAVEITALLLPLLVILGYKWSENKSPVGERLLVVGIEGFESMTNYLANTLSFLRVAAFSLNHVALAVAIFTLAGMMDPFGHWTTIVLGNCFIIVLEGAIVTIQVLRLEYYEGFSRYFSGDGREFKPLQYGKVKG